MTDCCPTCGKPNVQTRTSPRTGRDYLANVETYPRGRTYFRGVHTSEQCARIAASREQSRIEWAERAAAQQAEADLAAAREQVHARMGDEIEAWRRAGADLAAAGASAEDLLAHHDTNPFRLECIRLGLLDA